MVILQVLNKILKEKSIDFINNNNLDIDYFKDYEDEYKFITEHYKEYGNIPDTATFVEKFPDFELVEVQESDKYLIDKLNEEYLFNKSLPTVQKIVDLMNVDSNKAIEYMFSATKELQPKYSMGGINIIQQAQDRYNEFVERKDNQDEWFFTTGFPELDDVIHGIQRTEEYFVIFARTNQGKSWVLEKICTHIWEIGFNVGYISPEMTASSIGYRFDTLHKNFSNKDLMWGNNNVNVDEYKNYIDKLSEHTNSFIVATPQDLGNKMTVSTIRNFVKQNKLDLIAIDGITYMTDERYSRGDNKTTSLTHISEDLMSLSIELGVPVLVVVQANRSGVTDDEDSLPELESIRDSDGISHNASKVISLKQSNDGVLTLQVKKQRNGRVGDKIQYMWTADKGEFISMNSNTNTPKEKRKIEKAEDVF